MKRLAAVSLDLLRTLDSGARHLLLPNHISLTHTLNRVSLSLSVGVCRESEREGTHTQSKTEYSVFWRGLYQLSY